MSIFGFIRAGTSRIVSSLCRFIILELAFQIFLHLEGVDHHFGLDAFCPVLLSLVYPDFPLQLLVQRVGFDIRIAFQLLMEDLILLLLDD